MFAEMYMVESLKGIALNNLAFDLYHLEIGTETIAAVVDLIQYTYESTPKSVDDNDDLPIAKLRRCVFEFVLVEKEQLVRFSEFNDLVSRGGDFAVDLVCGKLNHA